MADPKPLARAALFVAALVGVLLAALAVGTFAGPIVAEPSAEHSEGHSADQAEAGGDHADYRMELPQVRFAPGDQSFSFTVVGPGGPLATYDERHERDLHLIVVRRDLTGFQHVHPTLDPDSGFWTTDLALDSGSWRVLADFVPAGGEQVVLGADLLVEGAGQVQPLGEDVLGTSVDGYDVILDVTPEVGVESRAVVTVMRGGQEVTDLGEYLGELGHLVVLRDGDLDYTHAHPVESASTGPVIPFDLTFPSGGRYRLFAEFEHDGAVHTAVFTVSVEPGDGHTHDHGGETGEPEGDHEH